MPGDVHKLNDCLSNGPAGYLRLSCEVQALQRKRHELSEKVIEIIRQFSEDDVVVSSGPRKGKPLSTYRKTKRLYELLDTWDKIRVIGGKEKWLENEMEQMRKKDPSIENSVRLARGLAQRMQSEPAIGELVEFLLEVAERDGYQAEQEVFERMRFEIERRRLEEPRDSD